MEIVYTIKLRYFSKFVSASSIKGSGRMKEKGE